MKSVGYYPSPLGMLRITYEENLLLTLDFCQEEGTGPIPEEARLWLDRYFAGLDPGKIPPFRFPEVSAFRRNVWELLLEIPYGQTVTYGELAKRLAAQRGLARMSAQAVGGAVGHNPISIIIPCHRVLGAKNQLTGYAGGLDVKTFLLKLEGIL